MYGDASWLDTAGRLVIVFFFTTAGLLNVTPAGVKDHVDRMKQLNVPFAAAAFWFGTALEFAGCAMLLFDVYPAVGVGFLMVFTVVSTAIFHRFYNYDDPMKRKISRIAVLANTGVLGGLMLLLQNVR